MIPLLENRLEEEEEVTSKSIYHSHRLGRCRHSPTFKFSQHIFLTGFFHQILWFYLSDEAKFYAERKRICGTLLVNEESEFLSIIRF